MEIKYIFFNQADLLETDSSLSPGWFIIDDTDLFENTKCIITIAITDLAEGLKILRKHKYGSFGWIPADSGEKIMLNKSGNSISFNYKNKEFKAEFDLFYKSVYNLCNKLASELLHFRNATTSESAYVDLVKILNTE